MTDSDAVLAANLEFYRAFTARDLAAMNALWARRAPVACLHPGWTALNDRDAIIQSWEGILSNPDAPRVACFDEQVFLYGDVALVLCEKSSLAARWPQATCSSAKTTSGGSLIITRVRSSAAMRRGAARRGSIDRPAHRLLRAAERGRRWRALQRDAAQFRRPADRPSAPDESVAGRRRRPRSQRLQ